MSKYDFIYLFSNLFSLISLNGHSRRKKAQEGENSLGNSVGLGWPTQVGQEAHQGAGAPAIAAPGMWD